VGLAVTGLLQALAGQAAGVAHTAVLRLTPAPVGTGVSITPLLSVVSTVAPAVAHGTSLRFTPSLAAGLTFAGSPVRLIPAPQAVALALTGLVGGTSLPKHTVGVAHGTVLRMTPPGPPVAGGVEIVRTTFDLIGRYGAATVTNTTVAGAAWVNPVNAQGQADGVLSTHGSNALAAQDAYLDFTPPAVTGKDALTLTKVEVRFWVFQGGTALSNGSLRLTTGTSANPAEVEHLHATGNIDFLTVPFTVDVTARFPTFASLSGLRARVRHLTPIASTITGSADAVELVITANRTDLT